MVALVARCLSICLSNCSLPCCTSLDSLWPPFLTNRGTVLTAHQIVALLIAPTPLQSAAWLLLTAYRNLPMPYTAVPSPTPYGHMFSQIWVPTPKICMVHYGQAVSVEWLLLTGYRHLPMPYLMPPLPTFPFPTKQWYLGCKLRPNHCR